MAIIRRILRRLSSNEGKCRTTDGNLTCCFNHISPSKVSSSFAKRTLANITPSIHEDSNLRKDSLSRLIKTSPSLQIRFPLFPVSLFFFFLLFSFLSRFSLCSSNIYTPSFSSVYHSLVEYSLTFDTPSSFNHVCSNLQNHSPLHPRSLPLILCLVSLLYDSCI